MPFIFKKIGVVFACVGANFATAGVIVSLIYTAAIDPPTKESFAIYSTIIYVSFPFALLSQLSTGPMLDRVTPHEKKAFSQGVNNALYDSSSEFGPALSDFYRYCLFSL